MDAKHCNCTSHIDWNTVPHDQWPILPEYEEMPDPKPVPEPTAEEAQNTVWEFMVDLYEQSGGGSEALAKTKPYEEFSVTFIWLAYYIMRHEKARHFCASQKHIVAELRRYTAYLLSTTNSIYQTLCDFDYCLKQLA